MNFFFNRTTSSSPSKLGKNTSQRDEQRFCLMCGHTARDQIEYEQHLLSHFQLPESAVGSTNVGQKLYPCKLCEKKTNY